MVEFYSFSLRILRAGEHGGGAWNGLRIKEMQVKGHQDVAKGEGVSVIWG